MIFERSKMEFSLEDFFRALYENRESKVRVVASEEIEVVLFVDGVSAGTTSDFICVLSGCSDKDPMRYELKLGFKPQDSLAVQEVNFVIALSGEEGTEEFAFALEYFEGMHLWFLKAPWWFPEDGAPISLRNKLDRVVTAGGVRIEAKTKEVKQNE